MKITDLLSPPPETLTLELSGETMEKLRRIQAAHTDGKVAWKTEKLAAKLFDRLLAEVDIDELAQSPKQPRSKRGTQFDEGLANGASDA